MIIQRYAVTDVDCFETSDLGAWCKGKDVAELESERDRYRDLAAQAAPILRRLSLAQEGNSPTCPGQALAIEIESALNG